MLYIFIDAGETWSESCCRGNGDKTTVHFTTWCTVPVKGGADKWIWDFKSQRLIFTDNHHSWFPVKLQHELAHSSDQGTARQKQPRTEFKGEGTTRYLKAILRYTNHAYSAVVYTLGAMFAHSYACTPLVPVSESGRLMSKGYRWLWGHTEAQQTTKPEAGQRESWRHGSLDWSEEGKKWMMAPDLSSSALLGQPTQSFISGGLLQCKGFHQSNLYQTAGKTNEQNY